MRIARGIRQKSSPGLTLRQRWAFLLACLVVGALLSGVVLLARPPVYEVRVPVRFDPQRYTQFAANPDAVTNEAASLLDLHSPVAQRATPRIDHPVAFVGADPGAMLSVGRATSGEEAYRIAEEAGYSLSEALRTLYGWDLMRTLLRRAIWTQGEGQPEAPSVLTPHLFDLMDAGLLLYDPSIVVSPSPPLLAAQDVADMTLAVQRAEDRHTARINALAAQLERAEDPEKKAALSQEIAALVAQREQLRRALITLYREGEALVDVESLLGPPQVLLSSAPPAQPTTPPQWPFLLVGAVGGLAMGVGLSFLNESFGLRGRLHELFSYHDLIWNLVLRDLKARYKSSILGYLWSLVNPLLMMTVFTVLFRFLMKSPIPNFPVFIIVALLPWNFFSTSIAGSVVCITAQSNLIKKIYFPREVLPISLVIANLINYILALPAMVLIMVLLNAHFQPVVILFPLIVLIQTLFTLGIALFLSCLNVFFRDTQVVMEVLLTAWFFLTPVFYRLSDLVPDQARLVRWLNPMASLVDFYRDIFYLGGMPGWDAIIRTLATALAVLLVGYLFFLRFSSRFGEEV